MGQWERSEITVGCKCRADEVSGRRVRELWIVNAEEMQRR